MISVSAFNAVELIIAKREHGELSTEAIEWLIAEFTAGRIADEQMASMAMAILLNGMSQREVLDLTMAMAASGERLNFDQLPMPTADKHSTGGVGDKITLILTPLVACFGVAVPQLSGRGLGHTGGTLDKLEAISGFRAKLTNAELHHQIETVGAIICAAGSGLAPADGKLYALRDVTATVESIPLIASSIMSKKLAEGTGTLVLDVKCGSGAFMKTRESARDLAQTLVRIGQGAGVKTSALITEMSTPLGLAIGNALETQEAIDVLNGTGPQDVIDLTLDLAEEMLKLADRPQTRQELQAALNDGRAYAKFEQLVTAQGGDLSVPLAQAKYQHVIEAPLDGALTKLDALQLGVASWRLGAGRARKEDAIDMAAGIILGAQLGQRVYKGQSLITLHTNDASRIQSAIDALQGSFTLDDSDAFERQLVLERIN